MADNFFQKFKFSKEQTQNFFTGAKESLYIAENDEFLNVKFNYSYNALLKASIALLSLHNLKVRGIPGHHIKLIEKASEIMKDNDIEIMADLMRQKRNMDLYDGGIDVTDKECREYFCFVKNVLDRIGEEINKDK